MKVMLAHSPILLSLASRIWIENGALPRNVADVILDALKGLSPLAEKAIEVLVDLSVPATARTVSTFILSVIT
jgi:hypothetical protein